MSHQRPAGAHETYEAYLSGKITPAEVTKRAQDWESSRGETQSKPPESKA